MTAPLRPVAILGLGLIGGSVARALSRAGGWHITAWSRSSDPLALALDEGAIQAVAADPAAAASAAPLVLLATPVPAMFGLIEQVGPAIARAGGLLTDVGSSKAALVAAAARVPDLRYVGGHPMSGSEAVGYAASRAGLFEGRPWVVVPGNASRPADVVLVRDLAAACGARPVELDAATHDRAVAAISHLPLVASLALAGTVLDGPDWPVASELAAQGWRDMTRLARGDPAMGGGMLATNAGAVAARLRALRAELDGWQERLDALADASAQPDGAAGLAALVERLQELADRLLAGPEAPGPA